MVNNECPVGASSAGQESAQAAVRFLLHCTISALHQLLLIIKRISDFQHTKILTKNSATIMDTIDLEVHKEAYI